jgi:hypothetical protein
VREEENLARAEKRVDSGRIQIRIQSTGRSQFVNQVPRLFGSVYRSEFSFVPARTNRWGYDQVRLRKIHNLLREFVLIRSKLILSVFRRYGKTRAKTKFE